MAKAAELQNSSADEFWQKFEEIMGGPDGLMTYRYLGTYADLATGGREGGMNIRRDMRNPAGGLMAAPMAIVLADMGGVHGDAVSIPAPVMTSVHMLDDGRDVKAVRARVETAGHAGRQLSFGGSAVVLDADNPERILAVTQGMGVRVADVPAGAEGGYRYVDPGPGMPDSDELPPLHEAFGARRRGDQWELPELTQQIGSTSGSLHHGPTQIVLEAAAHELASREMSTDRLQIENWVVMYTARGKVGPFLASGTAVAGNLGRCVSRMELRDEGNENRLVATALAVFRPVS